MICNACQTPIPDERIGAFPCPGCGRMLRRTRADRREEHIRERRKTDPPLRPRDWLPIAALIVGLGLAGGLALFATESTGAALLLLYPLCFGALVGYLDPGGSLHRNLWIVVGVMLLLGGLAFATQLVGFV
jgi:hypothetical protein